MDVLPAGTSFAAWYEFRSGAAAGQIMWLRHNLPEQLIGHGIGAGDINGDGRTDIVGTSGWAESPLDARNGRWTWHADFQIAKDCGLPILVHDVDGDSDADLIWGRGHDVGLYWSEQLDESQDSFTAMPGVRLDEIEPILDSGRWLTHAIDTSWSCAHTLLLADIDGDGNQDLVAGKRFQGHDGKDPGENDPLAVYWYQFDVLSRTWQRHQISAGGSCGIDLDTVCCDLDDDGDMDIIAPSRSGLHWLENLRLGDPVQKALGSDITSASGQQPQRQPLEASAHATRDDLLILNSDGATTSIETPLQFGARREQIRQAMQQVMGPLPASDQRVPLDIHVQSIEAQDNYRRIKLTYQADATNRVPAYLLVPDAAVLNGAAMLCLHPTHFELGKAQICGLGGQPSRFYAHELAKLGFVCLAPDYPGFGDYEFDFASSEEAYVSGTMKVVWNNVRAIDLLEQLPGVDRDRIGAIGHSLGGHNALFTAVFDGRLRCVVTSCGFTAFEDYYSGDLTGWTSARYMPLIHQKYDSDPRQMPFDFPDILAAIAPRPVFVNAPISDTNFAVQGVKKCEAKLRPVLQLLGADDATKFFYPDAGHDFPNEIRSTAYQWLAKQLNVQRQ